MAASPQLLVDTGAQFDGARRELQRATEAGDTAGEARWKSEADRLADEYRKIESELSAPAQAEQPSVNINELGQRYKDLPGQISEGIGSVAGGVIDAVGAAGDFARGAVQSFQGPLGLPDLPEAIEPQPHQSVNPNTARTSGQYAGTALGLATSSDPGDEAAVVQANNPGATINEFMPPEFRMKPKGSPLKPELQDPTFRPYQVASIPNPRTGGVDDVFPNRPGASLTDTVKLGTEAAAFGLSYRAKANMVVAGVKYGMTSAALDLMNSAAGGNTNLKDSLWKGLFTAVVGPRMDQFGAKAGAFVQQLATNRRYINTRTGEFTRSGKNAARRAGYTTEDILTMESDVKVMFAEFVESGVDPVTAARSVDEFGVRRTGAQAGRDQDLLEVMDEASSGRLRDHNRGTMLQFNERVNVESYEAALRVQSRMGGSRGAQNLQEAGEPIYNGLRGLESDAKTAVGDAYLALHDKNLALSPDAIDRLPGIITAVEASDGAALTVKDLASAESYQQAKRQIMGLRGPVDEPLVRRAEDLRSLGLELGPTWDAALREGRGSASLVSQANRTGQTIDGTRRYLDGLIAGLKSPDKRQEQAAIIQLKAAYTTWVDDSISEGMFTGDEAAITLLKRAQGVSREYFQRFGAPGQSRSQGAVVMDKILRKAESPEQALEFIFSAKKAGFASASISGLSHIKEVTRGEGPVWDGIKEAAFMRLSIDGEGRFVGADKFLQNLHQAFFSHKTIMETVFTTAERARMGRLGASLQVAQEAALPHSRGDPGMEAAMRYTFRRFGQREAFVKGHVWRGAALQALARSNYIPEVINPLSKALQPPSPLPRSRGPGEALATPFARETYRYGALDLPQRITGAPTEQPQEQRPPIYPQEE